MRDPDDVIKDPQLQANNIVVPLEGAGENLGLTISSPIEMHGVAKIPARRAPELGEHNDEVPQELGFVAETKSNNTRGRRHHETNLASTETNVGSSIRRQI